MACDLPPGEVLLGTKAPLAKPRALTPSERALVEFLLEGPLGRDELRAQAETARVDGLCNCGCRSVYLEVDRSLPAATFEPSEVPFGNTGAVAISATQPSSRRWTEVTLHVLDGYLEELEIWAAEFGVRARVSMKKLEYHGWNVPSTYE